MACHVDHHWIGAAVRSKAVGNMGEFYGTVESALYDEWDEDHFHVRDESGRLWHRTHSELTLIQDAEKVPA